MKKITTIILLIIVFFNPLIGQKKIEIPENKVVDNFIERLPENLIKYKLKDFKESTDSLNIRIWKTHAIFTLNCDTSVSSTYKVHTINENPAIISKTSFSNNTSQRILDTMLEYGLMELEDEKYRGIDGSYVFIEISTRDKYKIISYWSPRADRSADNKSVLQIINMINKTIDAKGLRKDFLNSLPPGGYRWGMSSIQIDRFLDESIRKTDFYSRAVKRIKSELNITKRTNHWEYPLIIINDRPAKIASLNQYTESDIEKFEILKPEGPATVLYGTNGRNGVIKLKTK
jgi:hypothetical protein